MGDAMVEDGPSRIPSADIIRMAAAKAVFGNRLIENSQRSVVVEVMISQALGQDWRWCSADWFGWDFEHKDGTRLEVKQSAARQTWQSPSSPKPRFDIKPRKGYYEGAAWRPQLGRLAHIYVFCYNECVSDQVDHCDPSQWTFYPATIDRLPSKASISLGEIERLFAPSTWVDLQVTIEDIRVRLGT